MSTCVSACCTGLPIAGGLPTTGKLIGKYYFPIIVPIIGSNGTANSIPAGTVLDKTFIEAKFNNSNALDRWYPFPILDTLAFADTVNDTQDVDGVSKNTGSETKGQITYMHTGKRGVAFLKHAYNATFDCLGEVGVFWVSVQGNVVGLKDGSRNLLPIDIETDTMSAQFKEQTDGTAPQVSVAFQYASFVNEGCLDYIDACNIEYSALKWSALAPRQVVFEEVSNASQTTIVFRANFINSGFGSKDPVNGLAKTDFSYDDGTTTATFYNVTDSASIVVSTLVQDVVEKDQYTATFAAQTAADVIKIDLVKNGYNMPTSYVTLA